MDYVGKKLKELPAARKDAWITEQAKITSDHRIRNRGEMGEWKHLIFWKAHLY